MSLRSARPARLSAVAVVILATTVAVASSPATSPVAQEDNRVIVAHRESRFASVWPQQIAAFTTLVSRRDRNKKVRVESPRGGRVWTASDLADHDVPEAALTAYKNAAHSMSVTDPGCQIPWTLLAAIGRVESNHGRFAGSVLSTDGVARPSIIGIALNGAGPVAAIADSENGSLDGDTTWDRAVGPMQFIPTTWAWAGRDGDGDGVKNPHDIDDAALAAADYLCGGSSLATGQGMKAAIFRYNPSDDYVSLVRAFEKGYSTGVFEVPSPQHHKKDKAEHGKKHDKSGDRDKKQDKKKGKAKDKAEGDHDGGDKSGKGDKGGSTKPSPSPSPSPKPKPKPKPASPNPTPQPGQPAPQQPSQPSPNQPNQPGPTPVDPTPNDPSPSNPDPSPTSPPPSPTNPSPSQPAVRTIVGELDNTCPAGWCLGAVALDLTPAALAAPAPADYDGVNGPGTLLEELTGLLTKPSVTMEVRGADPATVVSIEGLPL